MASQKNITIDPILPQIQQDGSLFPPTQLQGQTAGQFGILIQLLVDQGLVIGLGSRAS